MGGAVAIDVSCGSQHTLALLNNGRCFAWGSGCHGQLGIGVVDTPVVKPTLVPKLSVIKCRQVAGGGLHSAALTHDGSVYTFGWGRVGQLGQKSTSLHEEPTLVDVPAAVVKVACGWNHTLALTAAGECLAWGAGTHGQTASPSRQHRRQPRAVLIPLHRDPNDPASMALAADTSVACHVSLIFVCRCIHV